MPNTYGVTPADIAAELSGLYPDGFGAGTKPTAAKVQEYIDVADLEVSIAIGNSAGAPPATDDRVAPLARQVIINRVVARVMRVVYTGNTPAEVAQLLAPYVEGAKGALQALIDLRTQAVGTGETAPLVTVGETPDRDLIVQDADLQPGSSMAHGYLYRDRGRY